MIIVKGTTRNHGAEEWISLASGEIDPYGNPFTLIELRWNKSSLHPQAEYNKTHSSLVEDTIVEADPSTGGVKISYRANGSPRWEQKNGIGPYCARLARTPKNIQFLVEHFKDMLWTITGPTSVINEVTGAYEAMVKNLPEDAQKAEEDRIRAMHTHRLAKPLEGYVAPKEPENADLEKKRDLFKKQQEIEEREKSLTDREKQVGAKELEIAKTGVTMTRYSWEYLQSINTVPELKKLAKELGMTVMLSEKKVELISRIMEHQAKTGAVESPVAEKVTG